MTDIANALKALATTAPTSLTTDVLTATGTGRFYDIVSGPTGDLLIGWSTTGVYAVAPITEKDHFLEANAEGPMKPIPQELPDKWHRQVAAALDSGKLGRLPVDLSGLTEFQQAVLRKTIEIPPGQLRPYGWVAREIGKPGATRAVGSALNKNPVPVLVPCHRVGRSDGTVGRYAYGPKMKRDLLRAEGLDPDAIDDAAERGVRFVGSATTNIYCHPTCHNAKRIKEANRVELRTAGAAEKAGFRACMVCRPAAAA